MRSRSDARRPTREDKVYLLARPLRTANFDGAAIPLPRLAVHSQVPRIQPTGLAAPLAGSKKLNHEDREDRKESDVVRDGLRISAEAQRRALKRF